MAIRDIANSLLLSYLFENVIILIVDDYFCDIWHIPHIMSLHQINIGHICNFGNSIISLHNK